ncbi:MAG: ABC transporter ATP-binding protein [Paludibacter sp.]|nr:ABC transporter ATP-binding protein [Paludibacter sp.]MDD4198911.1 ABC transporter ATP-binding protein [Paludibacter sp.]MDD4428468.1 ABC transporter ATP-binding protein [Paludibacter sp.]
MDSFSNLPNQHIALQIQNLTKRYDDILAVNNLSINIYRNEILGLLGPNGAGKTTTISMICGLLPPSAGSIIFSDYGVKNQKLLIGYCPQENIYYPRLTCMEQLQFIGLMYGMTSKEVQERANELLKLLGLHDRANEKAVNLSGGMKRRLNICLAIIHNPQILVLDEPEAGLDPQSRVLVRDFIKEFGKNKTVILTTHNMDEADRLADRIAIIDHGCLLMSDTPQNLKKTIGEGDILEVIVENNDNIGFINCAKQLSMHFVNVKTNANSILIKNPGIIEHLSAIKNMADNFSLTIKEYKLRENTLEDVFIHLTGRSLRQ